MALQVVERAVAVGARRVQAERLAELDHLFVVVEKGRRRTRLLPDDELIASGPDEGREFLVMRCGWRLVDPDGDGERELEPVTAGA